MTISIVDVTLDSSDAESGVFYVTFMDSDTCRTRTVLAFYDVGSHSVSVATTLNAQEETALAEDSELRSDMREAVLAERDYQRELLETANRAAKLSEQRSQVAAQRAKHAIN
jgi:hypothetical protein